MRNIKLLIEYDGTNYSGWQIQPNASSIQQEIENAVLRITGQKCHLNGSGRTDAGVHARGQVANFKTESRVPAERFAYAINSMLPRDIVIKDSCEVDLDFHARFSAVGKKYSYQILNSQFPSALMRNYAYHINYGEKLDLGKMKAAASLFLGEHDFFGFMATGSKVKDTIRTIYEISIKNENDSIQILYHGNGFLYNMVRIITGTLLNAAIGKISVSDIPEIICSKDRSLAGITVPACGLYLEEVIYCKI